MTQVTQSHSYDGECMQLYLSPITLNSLVQITCTLYTMYIYNVLVLSKGRVPIKI